MEIAGDTFSEVSLWCFDALALPAVWFPWLPCLQPLILSRQKVINFTQTSPNNEFKEYFFASTEGAVSLETDHTRGKLPPQILEFC